MIGVTSAGEVRLRIGVSMIDPRRPGDITRPGPARKPHPPRGLPAHAGALPPKGFSWKCFPVPALLSRHRPFRTHAGAIDRGLCASFASYWYLHPHPRGPADPASQEPRCPQLTRVQKNHPRGLTRVQKHHPRAGATLYSATTVIRCVADSDVQNHEN